MWCFRATERHGRSAHIVAEASARGAEIETGLSHEISNCTRFRRMHCLFVAAVVLATIAAGCGDSEKTASPEPATVTQVVTQPAVTTKARMPAAESRRSTAGSRGRSGASSGGCSHGQIKVPNVVGMDHQLAQDRMQAAGLYALDEEDATGQNRLLFFDRNWTTVKQRPPPGTCVADDTTILLSAKKDGE